MLKQLWTFINLGGEAIEMFAGQQQNILFYAIIIFLKIVYYFVWWLLFLGLIYFLQKLIN